MYDIMYLKFVREKNKYYCDNKREKVREMVNKIKELLERKIYRIIILVLLGLILLGGVYIVFSTKKSSVDTQYLLAELQKSSELTTAKLTYKGFSEFEDEGLAILNKSSFKMIYKATARAGIDLSKVKIKDDPITKTIWLTIPKSIIFEVKVDPESIEYFDEKFSLFNFDSKEDANRANALAEKRAKEELSKMGILKMADDQAEALIKGLLQDLVPDDYEIKKR